MNHGEPGAISANRVTSRSRGYSLCQIMDYRGYFVYCYRNRLHGSQLSFPLGLFQMYEINNCTVKISINPKEGIIIIIKVL